MRAINAFATFVSAEAGITSQSEHSQLADMEEGHEDKEDVLAHAKEEVDVLVDWSTLTDAPR